MDANAMIKTHLLAIASEMHVQNSNTRSKPTMTYTVTKTPDEIDEVLNECVAAEGRSRYPGMSYEEGVRVGIEWALGLADEPPFDTYDKDDEGE